VHGHPDTDETPAIAPGQESRAALEARAFFTRLNHDYMQVHKAKEDLFWATYMATSDDHAGFARAEQAYKAFVADPATLAATRRHVAAVESAQDAAQHADLVHGLRGWRAMFEANVVEGGEAAALMAELVEAEAALFAARQSFVLYHVNERGERQEATLATLATNAATNPVEERRRTSFEAFRQLERWVLEHGYLEIVALRNRFARALGYENYFDLKVRKQERMTPRQLFDIIDDFLGRTAEANRRSLAALRAQHGAQATQPWNLRFHMSGDVVRQMDPYLPFAKGLKRWVDSFRRLGITFRGATLQLDLLERPGKHQNGFCHSPVPAWRDEQGRWIPSHINFTAEASPDQVGSGWRALNTLFHEGGHAAHFANVTQNAPCFSQEYPPTSAAYAETQSMFCDSLLEDADWLVRHATDPSGEPMPEALIAARIASRQPFLAFDERSIAVVSVFEAALYAMTDEARTPDAVLQLARETEARILEGPSPRPLLAVPHLLNQESSAAYHGYLLAEMAVYQTRDHLVARLGYLTDNPAVGPLLDEHYWRPGNSVTHDATLVSLTGERLSGRSLAEACNLSVDEALAAARESIRAAGARRTASRDDGTLAAAIRVVHGSEVVADNSHSDERLCAEFEHWVEARYPRG
jgi:Zn-dependent oligopeptidase